MGLNNDPVSFSCMRLEDFLSLSHKLTTTGKWGVERTAPPQAAKHMTSGKGLGTHEKADPKPAVTKTKNLFFFLIRGIPQTALELMAPDTQGSEDGIQLQQGCLRSSSITKFSHTNFPCLRHCYS